MRISGDGWHIDVVRGSYMFLPDVEIPGLTEITGSVTSDAEQYEAVAGTMGAAPADVEFAGFVFRGVRATSLTPERCDFVSSGVEGMTPESFFAEAAP